NGVASYVRVIVTSVYVVSCGVTGNIEVVSTLDINQPGRYIIRYVVSDANGNQATTDRIVVVTEKDDASSSEGSSGSSGSSENPGSSGSSSSNRGGIFGLFDALGSAFRNLLGVITGVFRS